jgi:hypothetical protein
MHIEFESCRIPHSLRVTTPVMTKSPSIGCFCTRSSCDSTQPNLHLTSIMCKYSSSDIMNRLVIELKRTMHLKPEEQHPVLAVVLHLSAHDSTCHHYQPFLMLMCVCACVYVCMYMCVYIMYTYIYTYTHA